MRRTGFVLAAMLMVSGVAPAKEMWGTPKTGRIMGNDRGTWSPPSAAATPWSGGDELSGGNNNDTIDALVRGRDSVNCGLGTTTRR